MRAKVSDETVGRLQKTSNRALQRFTNRTSRFSNIALFEGVLKIQNNVRGGSTLFAMAALTVYIGSFTTWLSRRCIATLHNT
jgi:hypothetical protein